MKRLFLAVLILVITQGVSEGVANVSSQSQLRPEPLDNAQVPLLASRTDPRESSTELGYVRTRPADVAIRSHAVSSMGNGGPEPVLTAIGTAALGGTATWCAPTPRYCRGWGGNAHLGAMHSFHYGDKPYLVTVRHGGRRTTVLVVSFCACHGSSRNIDLSPAAFRELSPLSAGRIDVTISRGASAPATDTAP